MVGFQVILIKFLGNDVKEIDFTSVEISQFPGNIKKLNEKVLRDFLNQFIMIAHIDKYLDFGEAISWFDPFLHQLEVGKDLVNKNKLNVFSLQIGPHVGDVCELVDDFLVLLRYEVLLG